MSTVEELFKRSSQVLEQNVRIPVIMQKLAERGYVPSTQEEANELFKVAEKIGEKLATGEVLPIPMRELEQDGTLSKHAADRSNNDFLAFAPEVSIDATQLQPEIVKAAAVSMFVQLAGE